MGHGTLDPFSPPRSCISLVLLNWFSALDKRFYKSYNKEDSTSAVSIDTSALQYTLNVNMNISIYKVIHQVMAVCSIIHCYIKQSLCWSPQSYEEFTEYEGGGDSVENVFSRANDAS